MALEADSVRFDAVVYEDEVIPLREFLQQKAPEHLTFDFSECDDLHLAVIQQILAYQKLYSCDYSYGTDKKMYQHIIEGFDPSEDHCS